MSQIRQLIRGINWKYSIGEVILIAIGILIAFALSNWNDDRKQYKEETRTLMEIRTALEKDLVSIENSIGILENGRRNIILVLDHLKSQKPYNDTLDLYFGRAVIAGIFFEDRGAYETLTEKGRELITHDSLRSGLATLYTRDYVYLKHVEKIDFDHLVHNVAPYYSKTFKNFRFGSNATPVDYESLLKDQYFFGLMEWLRTNREFLIAQYKETEIKVKNFLQILEEEIDDR